MVSWHSKGDFDIGDSDDDDDDVCPVPQIQLILTSARKYQVTFYIIFTLLKYVYNSSAVVKLILSDDSVLNFRVY